MIATRFLLATALAAAAPLQPASLNESQAPTQAKAHFPVPTEPLELVVQGDSAGTLVDLMREYSRITGLNISMSSQVRGQLGQTPISLLGNVEIPIEHVQSWVETLLFDAGFVMGELTRQGPRLVGVYNVNPAPGASHPQPVKVPIERIEAYAGHPALVVVTVVELRAADPRALGNSLRSLAQDNLEQTIPIANTQSMMIRGTGRRVAELVALLREIDRDAAATQERWEKERQKRGGESGGQSGDDESKGR